MKPSVAWSSIEQNGFKLTEIGLLSTGIKGYPTMPGPSCPFLSKTKKREKKRECVCTWSHMSRVRRQRLEEDVRCSLILCSFRYTWSQALSWDFSQGVRHMQPYPCGCWEENCSCDCTYSKFLPSESSVQPQIVLSFTKTMKHIEKLYYETWSLLSFEISCAKD